MNRAELVQEAQVLSKLNGHDKIVTYYDSWVEEMQPWSTWYTFKELTVTQSPV